MRNKFAAVVSVIALTVSLISPGLVLLSSQKAARDVCYASNARIDAIRDSLRESGKRIGEKGQPGYQYYQAHPAELTAAKHNITIEIKTRWQHIKC